VIASAFKNSWGFFMKGDNYEVSSNRIQRNFYFFKKKAGHSVKFVVPKNIFTYILRYLMSIKDILLATSLALSKLSKNKLLRALQSLREKYIELEDTVSQLKAENAKLKEQLKSEKIKSVNRNANKPSSKQAE
jgi:cell division protein FtsB